MINIVDDRIEGLEKLRSVFSEDFSEEYSFCGVYLKGVLLHENRDVQLTYSIKKEEKTYNFVFILIRCDNTYNLRVPTSKTAIKEIKIIEAPEKKGKLLFEEKDNDIEIVCDRIIIKTHVMLSKDFSKEQAQKLTKEYADILEKKIDTLGSLEKGNGEALFRRDDTYNGIQADHHIMYKLDNLKSKDGSIEYEFLIELDKKDPCLGIYYGCKGLIKKGDNEEKVKILSNEWQNEIKDKVKKRLNNVFSDKKFDNRFKPTDNANDNTFWPFWISLHEDENILEVAARATIIIRDEYKRHLEGDDYKPDEPDGPETPKPIKNIKWDKNTEVHSITRFTEESYNELLEKAFEGKIETICLFERFLKNAQEKDFLKQDTTYEKAWRVKHLNNARFSLLLKVLFDNRRLVVKSVPWKYLARLFLGEKGKPFSEVNLRQQYREVGDSKKSNANMERTIERLLQED